MAKLWLERWWWLSSAGFILTDFWVVLFLQERRQWLFLCFSLLFFVFWVVLHWFSFFLAGTKTMAGLICDSPLPFSPSLCIYFFCVYALFLFCDLLCFWVLFLLSAGTKAMAKPILLSVLLLYFSFSFLCFVFLLCISALCFWSSLGSVNCWVFIGTNLPLPQPHVSPPDKHGWRRRFLLGLGREV